METSQHRFVRDALDGVKTRVRRSETWNWGSDPSPAHLGPSKRPLRSPLRSARRNEFPQAYFARINQDRMILVGTRHVGGSVILVPCRLGFVILVDETLYAIVRERCLSHPMALLRSSRKIGGQTANMT